MLPPEYPIGISGAGTVFFRNFTLPTTSAPDCNVIDRQTTFRHHFLEVAVAKRVPQILSHAQNDDLVLEMSPTEQLWSFSIHGITVPMRPPRLQQIRNLAYVMIPGF